MTDTEAPQTSPVLDTALAALADLRQSGFPTQDPVRWHHLEALASRLQQSQPPLQNWLAQRLLQTLAQQAAPATNPTPAATPALAGLQPLVELNRHLQGLAQHPLPAQPASPAAHAAPRADTAPRPRMRSLNRFQDTWARVRADQQLHQALDRAPDQAGPLNSHKLVLRSLELMRDLSPDYTRHLMAQWDDLLWLEQAKRTTPAKTSKPVRRSASKK